MKAHLCRIFASVILLCSCVLCGGCWDYRGLNQLTIVAGFALDEAPDGGFLLSLEIISADSAGNDSAESKLIQSEGDTIADAVYNLGTQFYNNVYFGNADVLVLSNKLIEKIGLYDLIDSLLRDNGMRDNLIVLVSGEETAYELITPTEDSTVISFDINNKILNNKKAVTVTRPKELYQIYGILSRQVSDLALPVIRFDDSEEKTLLLDGLAVFRENRLTGYFAAENMQYYLLMVEPLNGGGFVHTEKLDEKETAEVTVGIRRSTPNIKYEYKDSHLKYTIDIDLVIAAVEFNTEAFKLYPNTEKGLQKLNFQLEQNLSESIRNMIYDYIDTNSENDLPDIFGFADAIYYKDPDLWRKLKSEWPELYKNASFDVQCSMIINDTGLIKHH